MTLHSDNSITFFYENIPALTAEGFEGEIASQLLLGKRLYVYHSVGVNSSQIKNGSVVRFVPQPSCGIFHTCGDCVAADNSSLDCIWCSASEKCAGADERQV